METVEGTVSKVYYSSGGWSSILLKKKGNSFTRAAGSIASPTVGASLKLTGEYHDDPKYGLQFKVAESAEKQMGNKESVITYLSSGFIKGIGYATAKRIYARFGERTLEIIENSPEELAAVKGITMHKVHRIQQAHMENKSMTELINLLKPEITEYQIRRIYKKYGAESTQKIKDDPYRLIKDLDGIGFKKADMIAKASGMSENDPRRINACILHILHEAAYAGGSGHCYMFAESLEANMEELLGTIDADAVAAEIIKNRDEGELVIESTGEIYLKQLHSAETEVCRHIKRLLSAPLCNRVPENTIAEAIGEVEKAAGYMLEDKQRDAIGSALDNGISVITGGPGTGKTTIIKAILAAWRLHAKGNPRLKEAAMLAPTGKAAKRMEEVTGNTASTIHRGLGYTFSEDEGRMSFDHNERDPLDSGLVIVDEVSMADIELAKSLLRAVGSGTRLVLIGDIDQLPPIGPGNFFRDIVQSPKVPSVVLDVSHRQSGKIGINASKINNGAGPSAYECDDTFKWVSATKEDIREKSIAEYTRLEREFGRENVVYIGPMKTRSSTGVESINIEIRDQINPLPPVGNAKEIKVNSYKNFRTGDRVMQMENDYNKDVFNGDMGFIKEYDSEEEEIVVRFDDGSEVLYTKKEAAKLTLAYAMTVHKAKGSEYKATVVVCNSEHYIMAYRNLLYTGVTRAQESLVICGDEKTLAMAANTVRPVIRNSKLKERLMAE